MLGKQKHVLAEYDPLRVHPTSLQKTSRTKKNPKACGSSLAWAFPGPRLSGRPKIRTLSTMTRDRNLQFRGAVSTGFFK